MGLRRLLRLVSVTAGALFAACGNDDPSETYDQFVYAATHNSYSGETRGSIAEQLDAGVRFIELDVWDDRFEEDGDLHLGHDSIGHEVATGAGNPDGTRLGDWLALIDDWSRAHRGHAPLVVALDLKSDVRTREAGGADLEAIDAMLLQRFGDRILSPEAVDPLWPSLESLRGRVLVMLSGHQPSRDVYRQRAGPVAFIDFHQSDPSNAPDFFVGVRTGETAGLDALQGAGRLTRVWRFGETPADYDVRVTFPATDHPFSESYQQYCAEQACAR